MNPEFYLGQPVDVESHLFVIMKVGNPAPHLLQRQPPSLDDDKKRISQVASRLMTNLLNVVRHQHMPKQVHLQLYEQGLSSLVSSEYLQTVYPLLHPLNGRLQGGPKLEIKIERLGRRRYRSELRPCIGIDGYSTKFTLSSCINLLWHP